MRLLSLIILSLLLVSPSSAQEANKNCLDHVDGIVTNKQDGSILPGATIILKNNGKIIKEIQADNDGKFSFDLSCDSRYQISAISYDFTKNIRLVFTSKQGRNHNVHLELFPLKEFTKKNGKKMIATESIDFIPDDFSLSKKAVETLNQVFDLLEKYRHLKIEIGFHTDSRGDQKFLQKLTQKRAEVCAHYLIKKGIDPQRLIPKGYGATELTNHCKPNVKCTNAEHLANRRTEFVVIE